MTEIDELMDLDPLKLTKESLETIVQWHRNNRAREDPSTGRMKKAAKPNVNLTALIQGITKRDGEAKAPAPKTGGLRRV